MAKNWTVAAAKEKLSEVIERAETEGAQFVIRNGKIAAVVLSVQEWARGAEKKGTIVDFFMNSPLRGSKIKLGRMSAGNKRTSR